MDGPEKLFPFFKKCSEIERFIGNIGETLTELLNRGYRHVQQEKGDTELKEIMVTREDAKFVLTLTHLLIERYAKTL